MLHIYFFIVLKITSFYNKLMLKKKKLNFIIIITILDRRQPVQ